jgi:hypothetical protein
MDLAHGLLFLFLSVSFTLTFLCIGFYIYNKNQQAIKRKEEQEKSTVEGLL